MCKSNQQPCDAASYDIKLNIHQSQLWSLKLLCWKKNCILFWLWRRRREREIVTHCFISWMHSNQIISIIKERPKIKCNTGQNDFLIRDQMLQLLCAVTLVYQSSEWQANDDDVQPWEQQERFKKKKKWQTQRNVDFICARLDPSPHVKMFSTLLPLVGLEIQSCIFF